LSVASAVNPGLGVAGRAGGRLTVTEPCARRSRCALHPADASARMIRSGLNWVPAIRSPPFEPRRKGLLDRAPTEPVAASEPTSAWKYRGGGRDRPASSLDEIRRRRFGRGFRRRLARPIGRASRLAAACDCHQPHSRSLVLRRPRRLISSEEPHQRCSRPKSHRHATYAN
jgi:hypothetical protein